MGHAKSVYSAALCTNICGETIHRFWQNLRTFSPTKGSTYTDTNSHAIFFHIKHHTTRSADQEERFRTLENLLVCMRHCCQELCKTRGARALSVVYLHQFQYHVLSQALRYFQDDVQTERTGYVPTLPSSAQPPGVIPQQLCVCMCVCPRVCTYCTYRYVYPRVRCAYVSALYSAHFILYCDAGHSDLTSRFSTTCATAVDWVIYGAETFTEDHTHHFLDGVTMPKQMNFDPRATIPAIDVGFTRFLIQFFSHTLLPVVRKVRYSTFAYHVERVS